MKSFKEHIFEAAGVVAKPKAKSKSKTFAQKWASMKNLITKDKDQFNVLHDTNSQWTWTGHGGHHDDFHSDAVENAKKRVFGERKGNSHLYWIHGDHGIMTHPAGADVTHMDVEAARGAARNVKGTPLHKRLNQKDAIVARGRIEHHKNGGGIISYDSRSSRPNPHGIRALRRAYPKHVIHDGYGNELHEGFTIGKDGWLHSRSTGRRTWMKGNHSIERQGKRGWTVYDWHANKELHVAKTARDAKAWSEKNRPSTSSHTPIHIKMWENWSYAHDFDDMPEDRKRKFVYHVTTASRAAKIVKGGLKPRSPKGRTNYPDAREHTQGRAFVTNHQGVRYWKDQTLHAANRRKREVDERDAENIHVIKFPIANMKKSTRRKLRVDPIGTKDARRRDDDPVINPSSHEGSTALMVRKKIRESTMDFKTYLVEQNEQTTMDFIRFAADALGLENDPQVRFLDEREDNMSAASYCPDTGEIRILRGARATADICRSIAHELVHQAQHERGDVLDGETGSPCEDEANALAGRLIRMYAGENPGLYEE